MIREDDSATSGAQSLPRMRGDDPAGGLLPVDELVFAPHARG